MAINRAGLAEELKRSRARVRPEDVGLPVGQHRRVDGLRREELAMLAGISVDYVVRLEQARGPMPSAQVVGALARALRVDTDGRDQLFRLAGLAPPESGTIDLHVRPSVMRLIDRFVDLPTMVLSAKGDLLAWNPMSAALMGDWTAVRPERRNLNRLRFLPDPDDPPRSLVGGPADERDATARQTVSNLRTAYARYPDDEPLHRLIGDLIAGSEEFRELWEVAVAGIWRSHRKTWVHPSLGSLTVDCDTLHVPDADQLVVVYSATPGSPEAEKLTLLGVLGTQELVGSPTR